MLISRFQNVYDLLFAEIGQNPVIFLSATVSFELINTDHFRKLNRFAVLDIPEKADHSRNGQVKLPGNRGIGATIAKSVEQNKDGSLSHALLFRKKAVRFCKSFPTGTGIPALAQNENNRLFKGGELFDALQTIIVNFIRYLSANRTYALFARLLDKDFKNFFRFTNLFDRNLLHSEQFFCTMGIEHI